MVEHMSPVRVALALGISLPTLRKMEREGKIHRYRDGYRKPDVDAIAATYTQHTCRRCEYTWNRKKPGEPTRCPKCSSKISPEYVQLSRMEGYLG